MGLYVERVERVELLAVRVELREETIIVVINWWWPVVTSGDQVTKVVPTLLPAIITPDDLTSPDEAPDQMQTINTF